MMGGVTFNYLGHIGQLGNQMFQYAALRGIAAYHGYDYTLPTNHQKVIFLYDCFKISELEKRLDHWSKFERRSPSNPNFDGNFLTNCPPNTDIFGYFHTEKYFKHAEDIIRNEYRFHDHIVEKANQYFYKMFYDNEVISLHIRRTDFIGDHLMRNLSMPYYEKCLSCFETRLPVLVFSDDIEWCKQQEIFKHPRFKFSKNNQYTDLCLMTMCKYHINANSSFSWWGSWLAKSEKTLAPREWYATTKVKTCPWIPFSEDSEWSSKDICPEDWILV